MLVDNPSKAKPGQEIPIGINGIRKYSLYQLWKNRYENKSTVLIRSGGIAYSSDYGVYINVKDIKYRRERRARYNRIVGREKITRNHFYCVIRARGTILETILVAQKRVRHLLYRTFLFHRRGSHSDGPTYHTAGSYKRVFGGSGSIHEFPVSQNCFGCNAFATVYRTAAICSTLSPCLKSLPINSMISTFYFELLSIPFTI